MARPSLWCLPLYVLAVLAAHAMPGDRASAYGADPVTVRANDGRVLRGEVDASTDQHLLWVRRTAPSIAINSAVRWSDVVSVGHGDRVFSAAEFRPLAEELKSELPADFFAQDAAKDPAEAGAGTPNSWPKSSQGARHALEREKVRSLRIDAELANWDGDVEVDGLEVRVSPLAGDGRIVAAGGTLSIRLIGKSPSATSRHAFQELGRWSKPVRATDFGTWGAVYRFPFRTIHPEFDLDVSPYGLLHARLGVRGDGSFEASVPVRVRVYDPLRDHLQLHEGKRFFPNERTGWRGR